MKIIKVSPEDEDILDFKWCVYQNKNTKYAKMSVKIGDKWTSKKMHRLIMERVVGRALTRKEFVDHINFNGLDNRRENIRAVTHQENNQRVRIGKRNPDCISYNKYRGVSKSTSGKFVASVSKSNEKLYLGCYKSAEMAAAAYNGAAIALFGKMAILNFEETPPI